MATIFEKLNLKDQQEIVVLNAPASFEPELAKLPVITIHHNLSSVPELGFLLAFVTRKAEVDALAAENRQARKRRRRRLVRLSKGDIEKIQMRLQSRHRLE